LKVYNCPKCSEELRWTGKDRWYCAGCVSSFSFPKPTKGELELWGKKAFWMPKLPTYNVRELDRLKDIPPVLYGRLYLVNDRIRFEHSKGIMEMPLDGSKVDLIETTGEEAAAVRSCAKFLMESDSGLGSGGVASFYDLGPVFGTIEQLAMMYLEKKQKFTMPLIRILDSTGKENRLYVENLPTWITILAAQKPQTSAGEPVSEKKAVICSKCGKAMLERENDYYCLRDDVLVKKTQQEIRRD